MRVITAAEVEKALDLKKCIDLMKNALTALSLGNAYQIIRPVLPLDQGNLLGMMPAYYKPEGIAGIKVLSVFPENYLKNIPSHQGQMLIFETMTGKLKAIVDADSLTGLRTAATSAAVTEVLARPEASRLAILGAGLQGRRHLEAVYHVRSLQEVTVWDLRPEASRQYAAEMQDRYDFPIRVCSSVQEAVEGADIICTLTPAKDPILFAKDVKAGTHINAVGACSPRVRELSSDLMAAGQFFVDWKEASLVEAGDYLLALQDGAINEEHILGEVGQIFAGKLAGRTNRQEITIFGSLGQAIGDLIAGDYVARKVNGVCPPY